MFKNLQCLNFSTFHDRQQLQFDSITPIPFSSNLLELHITVDSIDDCLYLLDDYFNQLSKFYVTICTPLYGSAAANHKNKKLLNLKYFSVTHKTTLFGCYNKHLLPLLRRMPNLEELTLHFENASKPIIDGNNLEKNIINHMARLKNFTFNIWSVIPLDQSVNLPSNKYIQDTFRNFENDQIISSLDYLFKSNLFYCHVYSYPYTWKFFNNITNNFPGGLFKCVRETSLRDEHAFEHEFFLRIAQSFPFINKLILHKHEPQQNDNQQCLIIKYHHLTKLDLVNPFRMGLF